MQIPLLVTGNTMAPILDGSGKPIANGKLLVTANSDPESEPLQLYRDPNKSQSASNPISLNSAGAMPYPVYADTLKAWCHAYSESNRLVISYPLLGNTAAGQANGNAEIQNLYAESLTVTGDADIFGDLSAKSVKIDDSNRWENSDGKTELHTDSLHTGSLHADSLHLEEFQSDKINVEDVIELSSYDGRSLFPYHSGKISIKRKSDMLSENKEATITGYELKISKVTAAAIELDREYEKISLINVEIDTSPTLNTLSSSYPVGSYLTGSSKQNLQMNQAVYIGMNSTLPIDVICPEIQTTKQFYDSGAVFRVCGQTGVGNNIKYYLLRRVS